MRSASRTLPAHPLSWRSRSFRAVVGLLLCVLVVRWAWGAYVDRLLRRQLDEIRQRGEPATVTDVRFEKLPDAENAWTVQLQATGATLGTGVWSPRAGSVEYRDFPPYPASWMKQAEASEKAHAQAFVLARQARRLARAQLRDRLTSPVVNGAMPSGLNGVRNLANTVCDGAQYAHVRGDDAEAIERVLDVLHLGRSLHADPFMVSHLVAIGIEAISLHTAEIIAPGLQVGTPGTREAVRRLIAELLDEEAPWRGFEQSLRFERLAMTDYYEWRAHNLWLVRPLAQIEAVRANRRFTVAVEASRLRNKPQAMPVLSRVPAEESAVTPFVAGLSKPPPRTLPRYSRWFPVVPEFSSRYFEVQFRSIAERRVAAVSLAAQLYRADRGKWPERLDELVPAYLPAVPSDPYHGDGRPLGYVIQKRALPGGGDRPLVYFDAGEDDPTLVRAEPMYSWYAARVPGKQGEVFRQYRDLTRFEPPPSPQAVDNNPAEADTPRKKPEQDDPAE